MTGYLYRGLPWLEEINAETRRNRPPELWRHIISGPNKGGWLTPILEESRPAKRA